MTTIMQMFPRHILTATKALSGTLRMSSTASYKTLNVTVPKPFVYHVELNRPEKMNSLNPDMWSEFRTCFDELADNAECRSIVLSGSGKHFCSGIDVTSFMNVASELSEVDDLARKAKVLAQTIRRYQASFTAMEKSCKPVICAVHSACMGAGMEMAVATDIRYCTDDAFFQVKEIDFAMAPDVGMLQRLPKIIGSQSLVRDLCLTGRKMPAKEALESGLVSKVFKNKEEMLTGAIAIAEHIASKSPVAVQATKKTLLYSRDHSVEDSLEQIAELNQFLLQSEDFMTGIVAQMNKDKDVAYAKL